MPSVISMDRSRGIFSHLGENQALPACILTPKGRLCATLLIHREREDLLVEADPTLEEALLARLERYIVADDVTVTVEPARPAIHVFGKQAALELGFSESGIRVERMGDFGMDLDLEHTEARNLRLLESEVVESLRIERCIPFWDSELGEETLPPEAGLDRTHIDYDRGCYPGQEIISRLRSIGRVNRLLRFLKAPSGSLLRSGMVILNGEGGEAGRITSVAPLADAGAHAALAYLSRAAVVTGESLFALDPLTGGMTPLTIMSITGS